MSSPLPAVVSALLFACTAIAAEDAVPAVEPQPAVTANLVSLLPKYSPPKSDNTGDRRETDRPRNTIVRLPKEMLPPESRRAPAPVASESSEPAPEGVVRLPRYDVREHRLPNFKERELLTPTARVDLYLKRHPGLRVGNIFGLNRGIAHAMLEEEDARDRGLEMADLIAFQAFADAQPRPRDNVESSESDNTFIPTAQGK